MRSGILATFVIVLVHAPAHALLDWSDDLIVRKASASDTVVTTRYTFRNVSDRSVTIKSIKPSCHCTTADLERRTYAPGETGVIFAQVDLTGKNGLVTNTITVEHDDGMLRIDRVRMNVEIAGVVRITPTFHFWTMNGASDTKVSVIEPTSRGQLNILSVEPSNRDFAWSIASRNGRQELRIVYCSS